MYMLENSEDDGSDDGLLKIIEESPKQKRRIRKVEMNPEDEAIIADMETDLEEKLDEKAAKSNLSAAHVKNILKHVVTNEDVLAMVRQVENPKENVEVHFEPKITRSRAKELFATQALTNWVSPNSRLSPKTNLSGSHVLIGEELQDDDSDDEYIPVEEESEDDPDSSVYSECDPRSVESRAPPTPSSDCATQTTLSGDGVFKLPHKKNIEEEEANIALRTRSKLCLSNTPLEVIEESFIPPDITTDMYDMDCDDDDWAFFLKQFTRPLDEVTKVLEDEEHDPEYNVLADEEIDKVDKEELRVDKGVKVTRKELNQLIAELFDYADNFNSNFIPPCNPKPVEFVERVEPPPVANRIETKIVILDEKFIVIRDDQKLLLQQQLREHVQMLAQNFLLTYQHPQFHNHSNVCKEYLMEIGTFSNQSTIYNLKPAIELITSWETKLNVDNEENKEYHEHVKRVLFEDNEARTAGLYYIPTFPKLLLETISKSEVFLYPALLPRIPFKPTTAFCLASISDPEMHLIALGLEQFIPFLKLDQHHLNCKGEIKLKDVCFYIQKYMMPCKDYVKMYKHICLLRRSGHSNPIKTFFVDGIVKPLMHYVKKVNSEKLAPCKRKACDLPEQWKNYIYPEPIVDKSITSATITTATMPSSPIFSTPITKVPKPPVYNKSFSKRTILKPKIVKRTTNKNIPARKTLIDKISSLNSPSYVDVDESSFITRADIASSTPKKRKRLESSFVVKKFSTLKIPESLLHVKFNSSIFENISEEDMLPSMPCLNTPRRNSPEHTETYNFEPVVNSSEPVIETKDEPDDVKPILEEEKDNLDDINALMIASTTIRSLSKRRPTGAEKKKAKLRREFSANLRMLSSEDEDGANEKTNRFIQAFYDKVQEQLELADYHKFMEALNDFDEKHSTYQQLFKSVEDIIGEKHPDILDEFLTFFTSLQAKTMGKLVPYLIMNSMSLFLRKLELFFKDQPSQVRKIYRALTDLATSKDVTITQVKNSILPLLKGNGLLTDWFLQIFPTEKPPDRLLNTSWEMVDIGKESSLANEDLFENIIIPEVEDPYGGPSCICSCHNVDDITFKTRARHCIPCGVKFLQGRIFVQTGKGLRLAKLSFDDNNVDHASRLSIRNKPKRTEISPSKQISPGKDSQDENRLSSDDEPDKKQQRLLKTAKKRKPKKKIEDPTITSKMTQTKPKKCVIVVNNEKDENPVKKDSSDLNNENTSDSSLNELKNPIEENIEWDCNTSIESIEIKLSPEHASAESESEFCEETSQDNNTDTDVSGGESESPLSPNQLVQWTREEDKIILETFQREENKEEAFLKISMVLENRSIPQIRQRFDMLINLLKEMSMKC